MFHKNVRSSAKSGLTAFPVSSRQYPEAPLPNPAGLRLVPSGGGGTPQTQPPSSRLIDLISIASHRCSSFLAEAAVLVLVLALLDRLIAKGHVEMGWILGAGAISLGLLLASIATDFTARRWLKAH